jgi:transcriptional regulator with XRE-family HTH domain
MALSAGSRFPDTAELAGGNCGSIGLAAGGSYASTLHEFGLRAGGVYDAVSTVVAGVTLRNKVAGTLKNSGGSISVLFRDELRRARNQAGLTQEELAAKVTFSSALVAAIETGRRSPSVDFSGQCDSVFGTDGLFGRMQARLMDEAAPSWLREWAEIERDAVILRSWELVIVPGLLQTPDYAREILSTVPGASEDETGQRVSKRLDRQTVLDRDNPPTLFAVMEEGALRREVGGPQVMKGQMEWLLEIGSRAKVTLQVVPATAGTHAGLSGPFVVASFRSAPDVAYVDTALTGQLVERQDDIGELMMRFDTVRGAALPCVTSAELIREVMSSWS